MKTPFLLIAAMLSITAITAVAADYPGYNAPQFPVADNITAEDAGNGSSSSWPTIVITTSKEVDWVAFFTGKNQYPNSSVRTFEGALLCVGGSIALIFGVFTLFFRRRNSHEDVAPDPPGFDRYGWK